MAVLVPGQKRGTGRWSGWSRRSTCGRRTGVPGWRRACCPAGSWASSRRCLPRSRTHGSAWWWRGRAGGTRSVSLRSWCWSHTRRVGISRSFPPSPTPESSQ